MESENDEDVSRGTFGAWPKVLGLEQQFHEMNIDYGMDNSGMSITFILKVKINTNKTRDGGSNNW